MRLRGREPLDARRGQHVLEQTHLVGVARMLPVRPGPRVPDHPALDVVLPREESLADAQDHPPGGDVGDQVDVVGLVETVERVLVVDVQDEHVALEHVFEVDAVEQRLRHERDGHALPEVGTLTEQALPGADDAGQRRVAGEVGEAYLLAARGAGGGSDQQGEPGRACHSDRAAPALCPDSTPRRPSAPRGAQPTLPESGPFCAAESRPRPAAPRRSRRRGPHHDSLLPPVATSGRVQSGT